MIYSSYTCKTRNASYVNEGHLTFFLYNGMECMTKHIHRLTFHLHTKKKTSKGEHISTVRSKE